MNRAMLQAIVASVALSASSASAQTPRDSVVATVNAFFHAMTAHDSTALNRVQLPDGVLYSARVRGDSVTVSHGTFAGFAQQMAGMRDTLVERMWDPTVLLHGPIATVWAPYDIHRNREFVHCGVDVFTLIRTPAGWKIATITYTAEPTGCSPSPLGPLPPQ